MCIRDSIYADGARGGATRWAAERAQRAAAGFDASAAASSGADVLFTGEMVYPWMGEDYAELRALAPAAELLAAKDDWRALYDVDALRDTPVPCAALVSYDDIYVERAFSEATARLLGDKCAVWVTNEFQHSGLRDDGERVFTTLLGMTRGEVVIPS